MKRKMSLIVIAVGVMASSLLVSLGAQVKKQAKLVSVEDFESSHVAGFLGVELGKIVTASGTVTIGEDGGLKSFERQTLLEIDQVDGKRIPKFIYQWPDRKLKVEKPFEGERFKYLVHEQGRFYGNVKALKDLEPGDEGLANIPSTYYPEIVFHKDLNAVKRDPETESK